MERIQRTFMNQLLSLHLKTIQPLLNSKNIPIKRSNIFSCLFKSYIFVPLILLIHHLFWILFSLKKNLKIFFPHLSHMTPKSPLWFAFETLNSLEKGQDSDKVADHVRKIKKTLNPGYFLTFQILNILWEKFWLLKREISAILNFLFFEFFTVNIEQYPILLNFNFIK